jgi:heme exporter protein D
MDASLFSWTGLIISLIAFLVILTIAIVSAKAFFRFVRNRRARAD